MISLFSEAIRSRVAALWSKDPETRARAVAQFALVVALLIVAYLAWSPALKAQKYVMECREECRPYAPTWDVECYCNLSQRKPDE